MFSNLLIYQRRDFLCPNAVEESGQKKSVNQWFSTFFVCRKGIVSEESYDATSILYKLLLRQKYANSLLWEKKMFLKSICTRAVAPRSLHTHFVIAHRLPLWIAREFLSCVFHPLHRLTVGKERIVGEYAFANLLHYFFFLSVHFPFSIHTGGKWLRYFPCLHCHCLIYISLVCWNSKGILHHSAPTCLLHFMHIFSSTTTWKIPKPCIIQNAFAVMCHSCVPSFVNFCFSK